MQLVVCSSAHMRSTPLNFDNNSGGRMLAIRLPEALETRLGALAKKTGLTKTALAREAILQHIDDLEDLYLAQARARKNRTTIPLNDVAREIYR